MPSPISKLLPASQRVRAIVIYAAVAVALIAITVILYQRFRTPTQHGNYSQLYQLAENGSVASLAIEGETLTLLATDGKRLEATVTSGAAQDGIVELLRKRNVAIEFHSLQTGTVLTRLLALAGIALFGLWWAAHASVNGNDSHSNRPSRMARRRQVLPTGRC